MLLQEVTALVMLTLETSTVASVMVEQVGSRINKLLCLSFRPQYLPLPPHDHATHELLGPIPYGLWASMSRNKASCSVNFFY